MTKFKFNFVLMLIALIFFPNAASVYGIESSDGKFNLVTDVFNSSSGEVISSEHFVERGILGQGRDTAEMSDGNFKHLGGFLQLSNETYISKPGAPVGEEMPIIGQTYTYLTSGAVCSNGDKAEYKFNWGDGSFSDWSSSKEAEKIWTDDYQCQIIVNARCIDNIDITDISSSLTVLPDYQKYTLTVKKEGEGHVRIDGSYHNLDWQGVFSIGTVVNLTAFADVPDYKFVYWDAGDYTESSPDINLPINNNKTIIARFDLDIDVPDIVVEPPQMLDFGIVSPGDNSIRTLTVFNDGEADLKVITIKLTGSDSDQYSIKKDNCSDITLSPTQDCSLEIEFEPYSINTFHCMLDIMSNDPDTATYSVMLSGTVGDASYYPEPLHTNVHMDLKGKIFNEYDEVINNDDDVAAYVDDENGSLILVGLCSYGDLVSGTYGYMHIYGDDDTTDEKDGAKENDTIILKTYNKKEKKEYYLNCINGEPKWEANTYKEYDWKYTIKQKIPLHEGWNFISFGINKCFYKGEKPEVNMIDGIIYEKVDDIGDILSSIDGQYSYVRGFDSSGAKSYNGSQWSDMKYMAAGYGYWIKVNKDANFDDHNLIYLEVQGSKVLGNKKIKLETGWNCVGYLGNTVQHKGAEPSVPFPTDSVMVPVQDVSEIFSSIDGQYSYIRGFDIRGAKSYNGSLWSDLKYAGNGYGYWIKINDNEENVFLVWED